MKKSILFAILPLLAVNLFSTDLYVRKSSYSRINNWDTILASLKTEGEKLNINIIDYDSLTFANDSGWSLSDEEKIEKLEQEIESLKNTNNALSMFKRNADDANPLDDEIEKKQNEILRLQNKIVSRTDPDSCFPQLYLQVNGFYNDYYSIELSLQLTNDSYPYTAMDNMLFPSRLNISEDEFLLTYMTAFFPLLKTSKQKAKPSVIDSRVVDIQDTTGRSSIFAITPKDDYSFILRRGTKIEHYSPTWDLKSSITSKLPKTESTYRWKPYSWDGKNVKFGMIDNPYVYVMDNKSQVRAESRYKYPEISGATIDYLFFPSGNPVIKAKDNDSGDITLYFPQKDETTKSLLLFTRWWDNVYLGPNDTVWVCDMVGTVYILNTDGQLQKIIHMPLYNSKLITVLNDGTFITVSEKGISRHKNNGHILWSIPMEGDLSVFTYIGGARNGMYYLVHNSSRRIIRIAEADAPIPPVLATIRDNNDKLHNGTLNDRAQANLAIANAYYEAKSYSSALYYYNEYLLISPADTKAAEKKLLCEVYINKKSAKSRTKKAINLLDKYGEETARDEYQKAMKLIEKLKKQVPWDMEIQDMYAELKNAFSNGEDVIQSKKIALEVTEVDLTALFPALLSLYATNPSGYIEIKNTSSETIYNISVTSNIRKYMDFPSKSDKVPELKAGDSTLIPVQTVLNQSVLNLKEATPVQMQLTLMWESNGKNYSTQMTRPVTIYKSSALTWADTAMAACFVQPNDPMVTDFISKALNCRMSTTLSTNLTKAIQIADALGSIPLIYMSDPTTPATQVIDNKYAIDTIRLPSETLLLKSGDCDDMTTLFCSLMEGTSINSAFVTTPGHIFAAFDTGLPYYDLFSEMDKNHFIFEVNGNAWIPVECTSLSDGFEKAWTTASKEIGNNPYEITTISEAWKTYSSIPGEAASGEITLDTETVKKLNQKNRSLVIKRINTAFDKIDLKTLSLGDMNFLAKIYHLNGNDDKSIEILNFAVSKNPDYKKGYANLAMLYEIKGETDLAETYRQKAGTIISSDTQNNTETARATNKSSKNKKWIE